MSSYNFRWPHAANEVYVTGTFDDWSKSQKLEKTANGFEKNVDLSKVDEKIYYKFVVDGNWTTDHTAPSETDHEGNVNNVLTPEHILSSVAPSSTTAALAGQVPLEKNSKGVTRDLPGQFPETPANENQNFSVNPLPATSGAGNPVKLAPGEKVPDSSSYTPDTVGSNVRLDKESYEKGGSGAAERPFSVNPIPATAGAGNPVKLAPGEKVPDSSTYTNSSINDTVKLDKESYEKSGSGAPTLPPVLNKQEQAEAEGAAIFGVPPVSSSIIPESSLPMGTQTGKSVDDPTISSTGPQSTTAQLAGQQPIEPRGVPEVVTDSQKSAGAAPEASASSEAVKEKAQVEDEIKNKVPEAPSTSESGLLGKSEKGVLGTAAAGVAAAGAAVAGAAYATRDKVADSTGKKPEEVLPTSVQNTLESVTGQNKAANTTSAAPATTETKPNGVPEVVTESQHKAHADPEASASAEAVKEKAAVEKELEQKVKPTQETGEPAPIASAGLADTAPVKTTESTPAPSDRANAGRTLEPNPNAKVDESRDVSPMTKPGEPSAAPKQNETTVTAGPPSTPQKKRTSSFFRKTPATPDSTRTPQSDTASPSSEAKKKNNRKSFFGKLKEKLKS
ncbi:Glycogen recognition site of AMP-activated protein kinase-like protein [Elsinoe fawcettii]|nr:Glycogen recognition site of AMP-activated protein kinase-like protein [Elsinoe fawcettii]